MEQVAADVQDSKDFAPPQKKVRSEVLQDPFNEFRDGAPSRVIFDHSAKTTVAMNKFSARCVLLFFPILSKVARKLLATQYISAKSERDFSSDGITIF